MYDDPRKDLSFSGVYCLFQGKLRLVSKDLIGPNGLAFFPDEKFLYVDNWDVKKKVVMRYEVSSDGTLSRPKEKQMKNTVKGALIASAVRAMFGTGAVYAAEKATKATSKEGCRPPL